MENKKSKSLYLLGIVVILVTVIGLTYAFFAPQAGGTTSSNATVTSNTTDLLTFSINRDISFTVTQADFQENGENQSGDATATATLTPNNKTGAATMNYYLYLNLQSNPTVYSAANTNEDPELMLQVFDGNNQLVTLTGLGTQKTIKGVTGYDITGVNGLKTLLDNHAISATNNTATIENWKVVITLINLDVNQNNNTGKTIEAEIIISKEEVDLGFTGTIYRNNTVVASAGSSINPVTGTQWCDIETSTGYQYDCFDEQSECEQFLVDEGYTDTDTCEQITGTFGGVGTYETNYNVVKDIVYSEYYVNGYYYGNTPYESLEECNLNKSSGSECKEEVLFAPVYIKHQVNNNVISSTSICIHHNNEEVCFNNNEWIENDSDGSLTMQSLNNKINVFYEYSFCNNYGESVKCYIDGPEVLVNLDGSVSISITNNYGCYLDSDGYAYCNLPTNSINLSNKYLIIQDGTGKNYYNPHIEDFIFGFKNFLITDSNNINSYSSTKSNEAFILWTKNDGYDACSFLQGKMVCVNDLLEGTPGLSNFTQTVQIVQNRIETQLGNTTQSSINDTYNSADILIPGGTVNANNKVGGIDMDIYEENGNIVVVLREVIIDMTNPEEWVRGSSVFYCGLFGDGASCYNE